MANLSSFLVAIAVLAGAVVLWCLYMLYAGASRSTKRIVHICFWVALAIPILYLSPYLDFAQAFRRSAAGGIAAIILMGIYWLIMLCVNKSDKKQKGKK